MSGSGEVYQQIDRFVSASSPSDALSSLASITASIQLSLSLPPALALDRNAKNGNSKNNTTNNNNNTNANAATIQNEFNRILGIQSILAESQEFIQALCSLISENTLKAGSDNRNSSSNSSTSNSNNHINRNIPVTAAGTPLILI